MALLKKSRVVSEVFDCIEDHAQCIFVRQVRDIPLKAPPKEPPPIPAPEVGLNTTNNLVLCCSNCIYVCVGTCVAGI